MIHWQKDREAKDTKVEIEKKFKNCFELGSNDGQKFTVMNEVS